MNHLIAIGMIILVLVPISWLWARGIEKMKEEHPDYKGKDFLDEN